MNRSSLGGMTVRPVGICELGSGKVKGGCQWASGKIMQVQGHRRTVCPCGTTLRAGFCFLFHASDNPGCAARNILQLKFISIVAISVCTIVYRPNNSNQMRLFFFISAYLCAEGCPTVQPLVEFSSITAMRKQIPSSVKEQLIVMSNHMPSNHVARITGVTNSSVSSAGQPSQGLG